MRWIFWSICCCLAIYAMAVPVEIRGRVLDSAGAPIAGAMVVLDTWSAFTDYTTNTDTKGAFSVNLDVERPEEERLGRLAVYAPGFAINGGDFSRAEQTITLSPAGQAWGTVTDAEGNPVAGARVRLRLIAPSNDIQNGYIYLPDPLVEKLEVRTTADGRWAMPYVPTTGLVRVTLSDPRFVYQRVETTMGPDAAPAPTLIAHPAAAITGRVRFEDGALAPGVNVMAQGVDHSINAWAKAISTEDGSYTLASMPTSTVNVMVDEPTGQWVAAAQERVTVYEGRTITVPDLILTAGAIVTGVVTDAETGAPIPHVNIGSYGPHRPNSSAAIISANTDSTGRYRLRVAPGMSRIYIAGPAEGYYRMGKSGDSYVTTASGQVVEQSFTLQPSIRVTGTLVDIDGKPITEKKIPLQLLMEGQDEYDHWGFGTARLRGDGRFTLYATAPGTGKLLMGRYSNLSPWELVEPTTIDVPAASPITVTLRRVAMSTLSGRVMTPDGKPVPGATVTLHRIDDRSTRTITPNADNNGVFTVDNMRPTTRLALRGVDKQGYRYLSGGEFTREGDGYTISDVIIAPRTGVVSGIVRHADGSEAAGAKLLCLEEGWPSMVTAGARGQFRLTNLPNGEITLAAATRDGYGVMRVPAGAEDVVLALEALSAQPGLDVQRAYDLLAEVMQLSDGINYPARTDIPNMLQQHDAQLARALRTAAGLGEEATVGASEPRTPSEEEICQELAMRAESLTAEELAHAVKIAKNLENPLSRFGLLFWLGAKAPDHGGTWRREVYDLMQQSRLPDDTTTRMQQMFSVALLVVASRLGDTEAADRHYATLLETLTEEDKSLFYTYSNFMAIGEPLALFDLNRAVQFAQTVSGMIPHGDGGHSAVGEVLKTALINDVPDAQELLETVSAEDASFAREEYARHRVPGLAATDPQGALALARTITQRTHYRIDALLAVTPHLAHDDARAIAREVAGLIDPLTSDGGMERYIQLADRLYGIDRAVGLDLFSTVRAYARERNTNRATFAIYYRQIDPAESRLILEALQYELRSFSYGRFATWDAAFLALGMAPLDFERALHMARAIPVEDSGDGRYPALDCRRRLAQFLLTPPADRAAIRVMPIADHYHYVPGLDRNW